MTPRGRWLVAALLVASGLALAAFFAFLLGIADCSAACVARGERAPAVALMAAGGGLVATGALLPSRGAARAGAWGLAATGALAAAGSAALFATGSRGVTAALLALGLAALVAAGALLRRGRHAGGPPSRL